jgi:hypothetical protein
VTEQGHPGGAILEQGEAQEWVGLLEEEWVATERARVRMENAPVLNVGRLFLMKWASPVITGNAQIAGQKW